MARQTVKRLYDLEIDEISLVDRGANQHATVAIAKRDEDGSMGIYDADGTEVAETDLEHGDVVYDDNGTEYVFVEDNPDDGTSDSLDDEYEEDEARELVGVGKSLYTTGADGITRTAGSVLERVGAASRTTRSRNAYSKVMRRSGERAKRAAMIAAKNRGVQVTAAAAGGAAADRGVRKSLGESVYEELSKALSTGDRDEVIAKALDTVEIYKAQADEAWSIAKSLQDERDDERFLSLAQGYQLPVQPEVLAEIMKSAAATMPAAHVETLDRVFSAVGEQLYNEIGSNGNADASETMEMVNALALQHVGKSDLSQEQAIVALFDANPTAYDDYISEKG